MSGGTLLSELVSLRNEGDVAVIAIDNPPVNALSHAMRSALVEALSCARADASVKAIVIVCAGRTFVAGADISEFGKPVRTPTTLDVIAAIEASEKPVVAALHGTPLGGGLEVALACHYRVASPGTRPGLPEIKLGLMPGAGGTQRLPRLVGMDKAMGMILSGDQIAAAEALEAGLVDAVVEGDLTAAAVAFARGKAGSPLVLAKARDEKLAPDRANPEKFEAAAGAALKRARGRKATASAIEALRGALTAPVERALARERALFLELVASDESKAQRHIFFAEREAAKIPEIAAVKPTEIRRAAVIGASTMGAGIAMCFANAGIPVQLVEADDAALARGLDTVAAHYRSASARGTLAADEAEARRARVAGTTDLGAVADADIVIEAVFEDMAVKQQVFAALDRIAKPGAVLATNTSYLDVDALGRGTAQPERIVGMHFFSPAHIMRLLEVVRGAATSPEALAAAMAVGRKIGKIPVVVGVCHGFVGNRMHRVRGTEGERLLLDGALPQDVDAAMTEFGFPMGPFAAADLAGLDIGWRMRKAQGLRAPIADLLCEQGRFGQKTGRGFYRYAAGSRTAEPDPEVAEVIAAERARRGVVAGEISKDEIVERVLYPMINEGARILSEGIARRPGDIDVIWVYGYGFPAWRGGPMHYADAVGLTHIRDRLDAFAERTGDATLRVAPLLAKLAGEGKGFAATA
jgi:3-hydroxyacyl-CoA dehydrogenase